jgi:hypothetical protein
MIIKVDNFLLKAKDGRYDLVRVNGIRTNKKGEDVESFTDIGYSMTLENAIERIVNMNVESGAGSQAISLREFVTAYRAEVDRIYSILKK